MMVLQACGSVKIKDTTHCAVAGVVDAGADCVTLISGQLTTLNFEELIDLLQPNDKRGGAIITPIDDFIEIKKELETACILLDNRCTKEIKKNLKLMNDNLNKIIGHQIHNFLEHQSLQNVDKE
jgi:hypothetical protein